MARLSYENAETLVYDPVSTNRTATRSALYTLGFRNIETVATVESFTEAIRNRPPDLALCEAQGAHTELCQMIQALRQGATGYNPFIVIIVTAWENSNSLVTKVLNSGADDLILRPFSTAQLRSRIETHVERRKGFVITHDYVGPDRRNGPARSSSVELFEPPNSLKMKAKERLSADQAVARLDAELRRAREVLNSEKLRRDAFQVCVLWRLLQDTTAEEECSREDLAKLAQVARAVSKRARDTEFEDKADEWCQSVLAAVEGLQFGVDRNASMHLLGHAALNLNLIFHPGRSTADVLKQLDTTVAAIRARHQVRPAGPLPDKAPEAASG